MLKWIKCNKKHNFAMNKYICTRTYSIQEYDASGNKTEIVVAVGQIMEEGSKYLDERYCRLITPNKK